MNVLIIEAHSDANVGSAALVGNSVTLVRRTFPGAKLKIWAHNPESIERFSGIRCYPELFILPFKQPQYKQIIWLFKTVIWMVFSELGRIIRGIGIPFSEAIYTWDKRMLRAIKQIKETDLIISIGAERINDNFYKSILFSLYTLWTIKSYGKSYRNFLVLYPQTIGPFHFRITKFLSKMVLDKCDVIFLRDKRSEEILRELGVKGPIIQHTADIAVLQEAISLQEARELLRKEEVCLNGRPLIGISALKWNYIKSKGKSNYNDYKYSIAKIADYLIENMDAQVIFIPTNLRMHGCTNNDFETSKEIVDQIKNKKRVVILSRLYRPDEMKGIMGLLDMCIATRMHACIFSTGIATPTISINYQFKVFEYMKLMDLGEYTIDIDQITFEELRKIVNLTWQKRGEIRKKLNERIMYWSNHVESTLLMLKEYYAR